MDTWILYEDFFQASKGTSKKNSQPWNPQRKPLVDSALGHHQKDPVDYHPCRMTPVVMGWDRGGYTLLKFPQNRPNVKKKVGLNHQVDYCKKNGKSFHHPKLGLFLIVDLASRVNIHWFLYGSLWILKPIYLFFSLKRFWRIPTCELMILDLKVLQHVVFLDHVG